jgi:hypothetical protein
MLPATTAIAASPRHSGSTFVVHVGLGLCLALAALSGPVVWFFLTQFIWTSDDPVDYQHAIVACLATAALILLGEVAVVTLRGGAGHHLLVAGGILLQGLLVGAMYDDATAPDPDTISPGQYSLADGLWAAAVAPTSWPLAFLLLGLLVRRALRATSNLEPRRPQDP